MWAIIFVILNNFSLYISVYIINTSLKFRIILGTQRHRFETADGICKDKNTKLADIQELNVELGRGEDGRAYWLPYRKVRLSWWTWLNKTPYSKNLILNKIVA